MHPRKKENSSVVYSASSSTNLLFKLLDGQSDDIPGYFIEFLTTKDKNTLFQVSRDIHGPIEPARYRYAKKYFNAPQLIQDCKEMKDHDDLILNMYKFSIINREYDEIPYLVGIIPLLIIVKLSFCAQIAGRCITSSMMGGIGFFMGAKKDCRMPDRKVSKPGMKLALTLEEQALQKEQGLTQAILVKNHN